MVVFNYKALHMYHHLCIRPKMAQCFSVMADVLCVLSCYTILVEE